MSVLSISSFAAFLDLREKRKKSLLAKVSATYLISYFVLHGHVLRSRGYIRHAGHAFLENSLVTYDM